MLHTFFLLSFLKENRGGEKKQTATVGLWPVEIYNYGDGKDAFKKILELANGCAFVNEHLTKKNHRTTHMTVSKTPLTPEADNAKFKSYHLGTSVHSNCLSTATTHVEDILPLQKRTSQAIKRSSWTYADAHRVSLPVTSVL